MERHTIQVAVQFHVDDDVDRGIPAERRVVFEIGTANVPADENSAAHSPSGEMPLRLMTGDR